jgi:pimeloyl-ACP methyl ester carboxylesterase
MPGSKPKPKIASRPVPPLSVSAFEQAWSKARPPQGTPTEPPPTVSGRWVLTAASIAIAGAGLCAWLTLCLLFWQGSWQLLYHPTSAIVRTPASVGLAVEPVAFATTEAGEPRLKGWWIPAAAGARYSRFTVLYLRSQNGNLGDTVDSLAALHSLGLNILAFDYRGYGQSLPAHPSEAHMLQDADWALAYLTATRHIPPGSIIVDGEALGANLALEVAAARPELAGVVLQSPLRSPVEAVFNDPRANLVPARLLVSDRYDADKAAAALRIPSLWLAAGEAASTNPAGYDRVSAGKLLIWLPRDANQQRADAYRRWLDELPGSSGRP